MKKVFICQGFLVEFSYSLCNNTYYEKNAFVQISINNSFYANMKSSKKKFASINN